jgi:hypothetical protein
VLKLSWGELCTSSVCRREWQDVLVASCVWYTSVDLTCGVHRRTDICPKRDQPIRKVVTINSVGGTLSLRT